MKRRRLTEQQKQYIIANFKYKTHQEIADEMGVPIQTVGTFAGRQGLRKRKQEEFAYSPPEPIVYPKYIPGQQIKVNVRELNRDRVTRRKATVAEVYEYHVLLLVPNQYGNASTRTSMNYFDLAHDVPVVI